MLAVLVAEIKRGRFRRGDPKSFISYSEALKHMGVPARGLAGHQLQREGLDELTEWTKAHAEIPKIAALIVDKKTKRPGFGFAKSHGHSESDWENWWLKEATRAIEFEHWEHYVGQEGISYPPATADAAALHERPDRVDYRKIITIEAGKRGGKPCIRGMRITVADVLGWLAAGMSHAEIRDDFPELTEEDIRACLAFAAEKESHAVSLPA